MEYKFRGSMEIRIPEGLEFKFSGESKEEALSNMIESLVSDGSIVDMLNTDYLRVTAIKKTYKVKVVETFVNYVEIDTEDYPELEDEYDAENYVRNNLEDFRDDMDYSEYEREDIETDCDRCDTEEEETEV